MVKENELAPNFSLPADDGTVVTRDSLRGMPVVLYFYPRDNTPGCTVQACEFRDAFPAFESPRATIIGVSTDSIESHVKFKEKHNLPFRLLSDTDHVVAETYGVWKEKNMYGKKHWGVERTTFILDKTGKVVKVFRRVKPEGHAAEVEAVLRGLS